MRWPWRRRRGGRVVFIGTSPFDVAQVIASFPTPSPVVSAWIPDEPAAPAAPEPAPGPAYEPLAEATALAQAAALAEVSALAEAYQPPAAPSRTPEAGPPQVHELFSEAAAEPVAPAPRPRPAPEERLGVQLGFADGTVMTLDDDDPRAVALRAAAARLTGTG